MTERRYSDEEVSAIFARATEAPQDAPRTGLPGEGMTLAQLQEIGREVGIEPEAVARAARSLDQAPPVRQPPPATFLGRQVGVAHVVELPYRMTEAHWQRLVVDLRETFDAAGRVHSDGTFRQWSNGNLRVLVEPSGDGQRVRFRTVKSSAQTLMTAGLSLLGLALVVMVLPVLEGGGALGEALQGAATLVLLAAGIFAAGVIQVPSWAKLRKSQMEEISDRLLRAGPDRPPTLPNPRTS